MACLSPSQHLFNSFIVDFDDSDPVPLQHNNKHFIKHSGSIPPSPSITPELTLAHPGDSDPKADSIKAGAALGMTLSPSLALPHAALSSPSDSASPLSPPNSDSTSSSNASPAVPLLSLDSASHSSLSPPANSAAGTPSAVVKSESASEGLSPNLTMELGLPGQQPAGTGRMPPDLSRQQAAGKGGCWLVLLSLRFQIFPSSTHALPLCARSRPSVKFRLLPALTKKMVTDYFALLCVLCSSIGRVASGEK